MAIHREKDRGRVAIHIKIEGEWPYTEFVYNDDEKEEIYKKHRGRLKSGLLL